MGFLLCSGSTTEQIIDRHIIVQFMADTSNTSYIIFQTATEELLPREAKEQKQK